MTTSLQTENINDKKGQVVKSAAEIYETFFVPALFAQWPPKLAEILELSQDEQILDVACGTGIVARYFAKRAGSPQIVHGLDINNGMLDVAKLIEPAINWQQGAVEDLPYPDSSFHYVICQFGLMFFQNRQLAIQEMMRVLKPGGKLVLVVWDELENSPGYKMVVDLLQDMFGNSVANEIRAPFILGDKVKLKKVLTAAGLTEFVIHTQAGTAYFPSVDDWIFTDIKGWTLADMLDDQQFEQFSLVASEVLQKYTDNRGAVQFATPAHVVVVEKQ